MNRKDFVLEVLFFMVIIFALFAMGMAISGCDKNTNHTEYIENIADNRVDGK